MLKIVLGIMYLHTTLPYGSPIGIVVRKIEKEEITRERGRFEASVKVYVQKS